MSALCNAVALVFAVLVTTARAPAAADVVIRAADISQSALNGSWTLESDASSPGGLKLTATADEEEAQDVPLSAPESYFDASFYADAQVPYRVWLRIGAARPAPGASVWVQFSDADIAAMPAYRIGTRDGLLVALESCPGCVDSGWSWCGSSEHLAQHPIVTFHTSGWHRVRVQIRDGGVQLDQIVLSSKTYMNAPPAAVPGDKTTGVRRPMEDEWRESR